MKKNKLEAVKGIEEISVPSGSGNGLYKEKGSRFIARAYWVTQEDLIEEKLLTLKKEHHSARHICYAYVLGVDGLRTRANDDGEPSSSAGKPILNQIQKRGLTEALVTVVRYFGGTKLGVSGLINAYRTAAGEALDHAGVKRVPVCDDFVITCDFDALGHLQRIMGIAGLSPLEASYTTHCRMMVAIPRRQQEQVFAQLRKITNLEVQIKTSNVFR